MSSNSMKSRSSRLLNHQLYFPIIRFFLFGYALCAIAFPDVGDVFRAGFLLLSLPLLYTHWPQLKKDPINVGLLRCHYCPMPKLGKQFDTDP
ncbi:hypothetical protein [Salinivibrio socompensis]|uniref:hypothetical protein n=1 Tax=Salinivibrio socompensis TaxID=1510206 RepID=UPI00047059CA|nr:hypothetical protein [Salinivibrio socompensis]